MKSAGSSVAGGTYSDAPPDIPRPTDRRPAHRPWCCDCKHTSTPEELDDNGRCAQCARAVITRAEGVARRAAEAAAATALSRPVATGPPPPEPRPATRRTPAESTAPTPAAPSGKRSSFDVDAAMRRYAVGQSVTTIARDLGCKPHNVYQAAARRQIHRGDIIPGPPTEGKQGQPTTRSSAPRATPASSNTGRVPDARPSTHREKNPPAAQEMRPDAAGGPHPAGRVTLRLAEALVQCAAAITELAHAIKADTDGGDVE